MKRILLENREQLEFLLTRFYERVRVDPLIGPIFNEVARVDWKEHVPKIFNFWDSLLFGADNYHGRPFPPHIPLDLEAKHFERWLQIFFFTVDEMHEGLKAEEIKSRAFKIGQHFYSNIQRLKL